MKETTTYSAALAHEDDDSGLEQEPETVSRSQTKKGHVSLGGSGAETISPPDSIDEEYELYEETGFVSAAVEQYADDVTMPGVRVTADSDDTEDWFEDTFLPHAGIVGGQRHQAFQQVLYQDVIEFLANGNILAENVKNADDQITGFLQLDPASCKAVPVPNKPILRAPDATEKDWFEGDEPTTGRDEAAAFVQYHSESPLGKKGRFKDKDEVPLSLNDVTYRPRNPPAGEIWGIPITRNIKEELVEFKNIRRDLARAIRTKAWGIWTVGFDKDVTETKDEVIIDDWEDEEMDAFTDDIGQLEPGEIIGHDGTISFNKESGEVPEEVLDVLGTYVKMIVAALPPPLYAVGFEDNINQFVVKEQEQIYEASVRSMQTTLEKTWTPTLKQVARDHGKDDSGLEVEIEPPEDESPIRSMELDDMEKFALFADGLSSMFGQDAYRAFKPEFFSDLVTQMPAEAMKEEAFVGVPGGVPDGIQSLSVLDRIQRDGQVNVEKLVNLRRDIESITDPGDVASPSSSSINPFEEVTGGGDGIFPGGSDDDDNEQEPERNPDGTLAGSS